MLSRADEHRAVLNEIVQIARDEAVDIVLVAGDLFDHHSPSAASEQIVYQALLDLAATGAHVVAVAGNHDHPDRLHAVAPILDRLRVTVCSHALGGDEGGIVRIETKSGEKATIAMLPFLSKSGAVRSAEIMAAEDTGVNVGQYQDHCRNLVTRLTRDLDPDSVRILVSHLTMAGTTFGSSERESHVAEEYYLPADIFPGSLSYVALGHIHRAQSVPHGAPIHYCGAPLQMDFGEAGIETSVLIVEATARTPAEIRRVPLRSGRKLKQLNGTLAELKARREEVGDAFLKLVLDDPRRTGLADEAREAFPNAVDIAHSRQWEEERRERPDLDSLSPSDLFKLYLAERNEHEDEQLAAAFDALLEEHYASHSA